MKLTEERLLSTDLSEPKQRLCPHPQVQATVVGFLAAIAAVLLGALSKDSVDIAQAAVLCASSVTTAFIAALSLGQTHTSVRGGGTGPQHSCSFLCPGPVFCRPVHGGDHHLVQEDGRQPGQRGHAHRRQPGGPRHPGPARQGQQLAFLLQRSEVTRHTSPQMICKRVWYLGGCLATRWQQR